MSAALSQLLIGLGSGTLVAPSYRSSASGTGLNHTITKPSGVVDGDILLYVGTSTSSYPTISGFINLAQQAWFGGTYYTTIAYKVASGEGASYTSSSVATSDGAIFAFSGGNVSNPIDITSSLVEYATTAAVRGTSVTTTSDHTRLVQLASDRDTPTSFTAASGLTNRATTSGSFWSQYCADVEQVAAGASGNKDATQSGTDSFGGVSLLVALHGK